MKLRNLLTLTCLLLTGSLTPEATAQEAEQKQEPEGKFTMHTSNGTTYYSTTDQSLNMGVQYLKAAKQERSMDAQSAKFEIGLFSRLNPKLDPGNIYGAPVRSVSKTYNSYV